MLTPDDARRLQVFKQQLLRLTPVSRLAAYGSRARGSASPDSDFDLYVEVPALTPALRRKISELAWELSLAEDCVFSTFVTTSEAVVSGSAQALPLLRAVEREGIFA